MAFEVWSRRAIDAVEQAGRLAGEEAGPYDPLAAERSAHAAIDRISDVSCAEISFGDRQLGIVRELVLNALMI